MSKNFKKDDWGDYATCYDSLNHLIPYQKLQKTITKGLGCLSNQTILNAGCGTGNLEFSLKSIGLDKTCNIWSLDFSEKMLEIAEQKLSDSCINFLEVNLNKKFPFKDNFFDKVFSINSLYANDVPEFVLKEFYRVMKINSSLILVTPKLGYQSGLILKEHCGSTKPDEYWLDMHESEEKEERLTKEAIQDKVVVENMLKIAKYNREIKRMKKFHFFKKEEILNLITKCGFAIKELKLVYTKQCFLITAKKEI
ncbi:class I SAM-dependent methyltransferase [Patescibacteria group bacterium]